MPPTPQTEDPGAPGAEPASAVARARAHAWRWFAWISLPLYVLDQVTKQWVVNAFEPPDTGRMIAVPVIEGFFNLHRVHNTGVAFGHFNGGRYSNVIFAFVALAALAFVAVVWRKGGFPTRLSKTAAALLVSGVIGNLTDRLARGYVVDFLDFILPIYGRFPSFNVADSCITVAAFLLFASAFQKHPHTAAEPEPSDAN